MNNYSSKKYPDLVADSYELEVVRPLNEGDVIVFKSDIVTPSAQAGFNPNFKVMSAESFSPSRLDKEGVLRPSPQVRVMDMTLSDRANQVFNEKINKKS